MKLNKRFQGTRSIKDMPFVKRCAIVEINRDIRENGVGDGEHASRVLAEYARKSARIKWHTKQVCKLRGIVVN